MTGEYDPDGDYSETTASTSILPKEDAARGRILVVGPETVVAYPLPVEGTVRVGRALEAEVRVDDPLISRLHASIVVHPATEDDSGFRIRDLKSSNGTRLRGEAIQPGHDYAFEPGEPIDIGHTTLLVKLGKVAARIWRLCSHGYFELRLEEECARAKNTNGRFAVMRIRVKAEAPASKVEEALTAFLGTEDLIALYAPAEYEILLRDTKQSEAEQASAGIRFGLARFGAEAQVGVATYPQDGTASETLIAKAGERVRGRTRIDSVTSQLNLVVEDAPMRELYRLVERVAPADISVLILGETGVGKEVMAKVLHERSRRAGRPLLAINCGALTEELLESELFGHEKGAFTGALRSKPGLLESANGGTVFLDEIGEMPMATQVALLRVLEDRRARRVGGLEARPIDVRFIAATNRELEKEIERGRFRQDLYYRLAGFTLSIPPLRERPGEVMPLAVVFATEARSREGRIGDAIFRPEAIDLLRRYEWPGNVRELRNLVERAVVLSGDDPIGIEHFPAEKVASSRIIARPPSKPPGMPTLEAMIAPDIRLMRSRSPTLAPAAEAVTMNDRPVADLLGAVTLASVGETQRMPMVGPNEIEAMSLLGELEAMEKKRILSALEACVGNQTRAAKMLGISRKVLISRLDRYGVPRPRKGQPGSEE